MQGPAVSAPARSPSWDPAGGPKEGNYYSVSENSRRVSQCKGQKVQKATGAGLVCPLCKAEEDSNTQLALCFLQLQERICAVRPSSAPSLLGTGPQGRHSRPPGDSRLGDGYCFLPPSQGRTLRPPKADSRCWLGSETLSWPTLSLTSPSTPGLHAQLPNEMAGKNMNSCQLWKRAGHQLHIENPFLFVVAEAASFQLD